MLRRRRKLPRAHWLLPALLLVACAGPDPEGSRTVGEWVAQDGRLDLSDWRPEVDGPVQLKGTWDFYWRHLVIPSADGPSIAPVPIRVPGSWHRTAVDPGVKAGRGFGTYRLRVELPPDRPPLALRLGTVNTAVEVFAQGESIWKVGRVAADPDGAISDHRPGVAPLPPIDAPVLDLVVQVSNPVGPRGGLDDPVWLGPAEDLTLARTRALTLLVLLAGGLLTMGAYHLCHFAIRRSSRISLYFGLCCLSTVGRLVCSYELLILEIWPDVPWSVVVKGGRFFSFGIIGTFTLYLQALWPSRAYAWLPRFIAGCSGVAGATVLLTPPSVSIRSQVFFELFIGICLLTYLTGFVAALRRRVDGAGLYIGGVLLVAAGGLHDVAVSQGLLSSPFYWGPAGAFFFLMAQSVILAQRSARSLTTVERQRGELQGLVDRLGREQRERERYEELSLAASGLAHETKNPLGIIRGLAQRLATSDAVDPSTRRRAGQILDQADRAASRLGDFLSYASLRDPKIDVVDLDALLRYAREVLAPDLEAKEIRCRVETGGAAVLADEEMLLQIVLNLMLNSIAASPRGAKVELLFETGPAPGGASTGRLAVVDGGAGIPEDLIEQVRKPYVTGRADGHGLGLALVERLAELHGWRLHIESRVGEGTRVEIDGVVPAGDGAQGVG
ncbi:MAG: sensor histidine kinase [Acidobacteriota bacterium]